MALAFVNAGNNSGTSTTRTPSATPSVIGQLMLVVCIAPAAASAVTMTVLDSNTNAWTPVPGLAISAGPSIYAWYAFANSATLTNVTVTLSSSVPAAAWCGVWSGEDANFPIEIGSGAPVQNSGTSAAPAAGSLTAPASNIDWLISVMAAVTAGVTITDPTGYSNRSATGNVPGHMSDSNATVSGAQNPTWGLSASMAWAAVNILITPTAQAGSGALMMMGVGG